MLTPGQKLFEYEIVRQLGQGGFAAVFEGRDKLINHRVAIKALLFHKMSDKNIIKRFIQEARIAVSLDHPSIVTIHSLRREKNSFYLIMEYLSGGSLQQLLTRQGKLPLEQAVKLMVEICEGLAKFHALGVIHRDIKAENILLTDDGRPKVIDFGIAHVPEEAGGLAITRDGFQPSTLLFSSPEQMKGDPLDARSDIYQLGALLYHMLAGQYYIDLDALEAQVTPHSKSGSVRAQIKMYELLEEMICETHPPGLQQLWREIGPLTSIVEKALAKDKMDRFKDAGEFAATLKNLDIKSATFALSSHTSEGQDLRLQNSRAYNKRGLSYVGIRNYEQAIIDFSRAISLDPSYAEAYDNRSMAHLLMGNYGQAVADSYDALQLAPDFVATYVTRGIAFTGLRDYQQAIDNFEEALARDPDNVYAIYNRANVHVWMSNYQAAVDDYSQVISMKPEFVAAYVNRGVAHNELRAQEQALADFTKAIDLNPGYIHGYYNRANLYRELRRYEEAVADYNKVLSLNPEHKYAYENRGDAYAALGDEEKASEDYARLIAQASSIEPKRFSVAVSMLMPSTPLDILSS